MYRGGLNDDLDDAAQEFVSSMQSDTEILPFDIAATEAHILMLYKSKIIPKAATEKILSALRDIRNGRFDPPEASQSFEDCHEMLEAWVTQAAGKKAGGHMQTGRSRNDQVAVAIRMKLRNDTSMIQVGILQLISALLELAKDHIETPLPLYTHLQHAQTGVLSHYMLAQADMLLRDYERFADMYRRLNFNPLGAGPVGGTSIKIDRDMTTRFLAFPAMLENSLDATSSRDHVSEFVSCAAILCVNMSRMAEDLVLWASDEFGFVDIADTLSSPSSAMPQKKNPDVLELVRGKAAGVMGDLVSVLSVQKGLASGYGRDLQEAKEPAWRASRTATGSLQIVFEILTGMVVNENRMAAAAESGNITALDVAEELVRRKVPFREAHLEVGRLSAAARRAGKQISELTKVEISGACGLDPGLVADTLAECNVEGSTERRSSRGGTSRSEQRRMIADREEYVVELFGELEEQRDASTAEIGNMWQEIDRLLDR